MRRFIYALIVSLFAASALQATPLSAGFNGRVTDAEGHAVVNYEVVGVHLDTNRVIRTTTNASGNWRITGLRPDGVYRFSTPSGGFVDVEPVLLQVNTISFTPPQPVDAPSFKEVVSRIKRVFKNWFS